MDVSDIHFRQGGERVADIVKKLQSAGDRQDANKQASSGQKIGAPGTAEHLENAGSTTSSTTSNTYNYAAATPSPTRLKELKSTENLETRLLTASFEGQYQMVHQLLNSSVDVFHCDQEGLTALHYAALGAHTKVIELLIKNGADVNAISAFFGTSLCLAALNGHKSTVQQLLDNGAALLIDDKCGLGSPLHCACYIGSMEIVELLFEKGSLRHLEKAFYVTEDSFERVQKLTGKYRGMPTNPDYGIGAEQPEADEDDEDEANRSSSTFDAALRLWPLRYTPLMIAAERGYMKIVRALIDHGAQVQTLTKNDASEVQGLKRGGSALFAAAAGGQMEAMQYLIGKGAVIDQAGEDGSTPLMGAAMSGCPDAVKELLGQKVSVNSRTSDGYTALMLAAACIAREYRDDAPKQNFKEVVKMLIEARADVKAKTIEGQTALTFLGASEQKSEENVEIVNLLLAGGVDIDAQDKTGYTALMYASINAPAVAAVLIDRGADITKHSPNGMRALHLATLSDYDGLILAMYNRGAKLDWTVNFGDEHKPATATSLTLAAVGDKPNCVQLLLELKQGVDVEFDGFGGLTSLTLACEGGFTRIIDMLLAANAKPNMDQLYSAVQMKDVALARKLFDQGLKLNNTICLLHYTAVVGYVALTKLLIENKISIDFQNGEGRTALSLAVEYNREKIVDVLLAAGADIKIRDRLRPFLDPMSYAVGYSTLAIVQKLYVYGADIERECYPYGSLLNFAITKRRYNIVKFLIDKGADMNVLNSQGIIAIEIAESYAEEDGSVMASLLFAHYGLQPVAEARPVGIAKTPELKPTLQVPPLPPRPLSTPPAPQPPSPPTSSKPPLPPRPSPSAQPSGPPPAYKPPSPLRPDISLHPTGPPPAYKPPLSPRPMPSPKPVVTVEQYGYQAVAIETSVPRDRSAKEKPQIVRPLVKAVAKAVIVAGVKQIAARQPA